MENNSQLKTKAYLGLFVGLGLLKRAVFKYSYLTQATCSSGSQCSPRAALTGINNGSKLDNEVPTKRTSTLPFTKLTLRNYYATEHFPDLTKCDLFSEYVVEKVGFG